MRKKWFLLVAAVVLVGVCLPAGAGVTYTISHPHSQGVGYADISFNSGSSTVSAYLGRFIMETKPLTGELPANYPIYTIPGLGDPPHSHNGFFSYCLEPLQPIGLSHITYYEYSIGSLAGSDGISAGEAAMIEELFGRYDPILRNDPTGPYTGGTFRTAAAALQLAIWKINLDAGTETLGSWDFTSGLMRVSSANVPLESGASLKADAVALTMLNSLTGTGPMASLEGLRNDTYQDLVIQPVPEPLTVASAFAAVFGLGAYIRRRSPVAVA